MDLLCFNVAMFRTGTPPAARWPLKQIINGSVYSVHDTRHTRIDKFMILVCTLLDRVWAKPLFTIIGYVLQNAHNYPDHCAAVDT